MRTTTNYLTNVFSKRSWIMYCNRSRFSPLSGSRDTSTCHRLVEVYKEYCFNSAPRTLVPNPTEGADVLCEIICFFIELTWARFGPIPTVDDFSNLGADAILTLQAVEPNICFPNDDVLWGVLKSLPPLAKFTLGFSGSRVVVACNLPTKRFGLSYLATLLVWEPPYVLDEDLVVIVIVDIWESVDARLS